MESFADGAAFGIERRYSRGMSLLKLSPSYKDYIWGGHRLVEEYHKKYDGDILAESWELSCHPDGPSYLAEGPEKGLTLTEYIQAHGRDVLGTNCKRFADFPILIKFIDARGNLSIQVHPDNAYAREHENQFGKTEMWYIMDAAPGAFLYYGFDHTISREEMEQRIRENTLLEVLHKEPVEKGDVLFIPSGTIHAICENIVIAEIQQNSNVTYRVYDYGRLGADGKPRALHVQKALDVTRREPAVRDLHCAPHLADCEYFTVDKVTLVDANDTYCGCADEGSFHSVLIMDGEGTITCGAEAYSFRKGDSYFITAGSGAYTLKGCCEALISHVSAKNDRRQSD